MSVSQVGKEKQLNLESLTWGDLTWVNIEQPTEDETGYLSQHYPFQSCIIVPFAPQVTIIPDSVIVNRPTPVTIKVSNGQNDPIFNVMLEITGWGITPALTCTTNVNGMANPVIDAPYGESLNIVGKRLNDDRTLFFDSLVVTQAKIIDAVEINVTTDTINVNGYLIPNYPGQISIYSEPTIDVIYLKGCGLDTFFYQTDLEVIPEYVGEVSVILAKSGYQIEEKMISVMCAFGSISGVIIDAGTGDPLANIHIKGYNHEKFAKPVFEMNTDSCGYFFFTIH